MTPLHPIVHRNLGMPAPLQSMLARNRVQTKKLMPGIPNKTQLSLNILFCP